MIQSREKIGSELSRAGNDAIFMVLTSSIVLLTLGLEKCLEEYIDIYHDSCVVQEWDIVLNIESDITIEDVERYKSY